MLLFNKQSEDVIFAGAAAFFLFIILNPVLSILQDDYWRYILKSVISYVILFLLLIILVQSFLKMFSIGAPDESMIIFLAHLIYYPIFLVGTGIIRWIIRL